MSASKYFGDGFNFCKKQIAHHHPDLGIDLQSIGIDVDLIKDDKDEADEKEEEDKDKDKDKDGEKRDTSPIFP